MTRNDMPAYEKDIGSSAQENRDLPAFTPCTIVFEKEQVSSLFLSFIDRKVHVLHSENEEITLHYVEDEHQPLHLTEEGRCIRLTEIQPLKQDRAHFSTYGLGNVLDGLFRGRESVDATVNILLPRDAKIALHITTSNGSITIEDFISLDTVHLVTTNAAIRAKNITCRQLRLSANNSRLMLDNVVSLEGPLFLSAET